MEANLATRKRMMIATALLAGSLLAAAPSAAALADLSGYAAGDAQIDMPEIPDVDANLQSTTEVDAQIPAVPVPEPRGYLDAFASFGASVALGIKGAADTVTGAVSGAFIGIRDLFTGAKAEAEANVNAEVDNVHDTVGGVTSSIEGTLDGALDTRIDARVNLDLPEVRLPEPKVDVRATVTGTLSGALGGLN